VFSDLSRYVEGRDCYKGSGPKGKGDVAFSGDLNEMGATKNELGINQGSKSRNK
jgi:hypothetical protein